MSEDRKLGEKDYLDLVAAVRRAFDVAFVNPQLRGLPATAEVGLVVSCPVAVDDERAASLEHVAAEELLLQRVGVGRKDPPLVAVKLVISPIRSSRASAVVMLLDDPDFRAELSRRPTDGEATAAVEVVGSEGRDLTVVPRIAFTYEGERRSASIGAPWLDLGANASFSFRRPLPGDGADTGLRVAYDEARQVVRFTLAPDAAWTAALTGDDDVEQSGVRPIVAGEVLEAGLDGTVLLTSVVDPEERREVSYEIEASSDWVPSAADLDRLMRRAAGAFGIDEVKPAGIPVRSARFRVFVEGDTKDHVRDVPALCAYGFREPEEGPRQFLKFYFMLNAADQLRLFGRLARAQTDTQGERAAVVQTRHRRLDESGQTSTIHQVGGAMAPVEFQNLRMHAIVAESPWVSGGTSDQPRSKLSLEALTGIAGALDSLHDAGVVFGDVKTPNTAQVQPRNETARWMLLDLDSVMPAHAPVGVARPTPAYALPALLATSGGRQPQPDLLIANDRFGFIGLVLALLSGDATARAVLGGAAYDDANVPETVRSEVTAQIGLMRGAKVGAPTNSFSSCATWLQTLITLSRSPMPDPKRVVRARVPAGVAAFQAHFHEGSSSVHRAPAIFEDFRREQIIEATHKRWLRGGTTLAALLLLLLLLLVVF